MSERWGGVKKYKALWTMVGGVSIFYCNYNEKIISFQREETNIMYLLLLSQSIYLCLFFLLTTKIPYFSWLHDYSQFLSSLKDSFAHGLGAIAYKQKWCVKFPDHFLKVQALHSKLLFPFPMDWTGKWRQHHLTMQMRGKKLSKE